MANALNPFFIIGAPRSGTSLLSRMLNHHDDIAVPFETDIIKNFHGIIDVYEPLSSKKNQRKLIVDILHLPTMQAVNPKVDVDEALNNVHGTTFQAVFTGILNSWAQQQGKHRWGEKSVTNVLFSETLLELFPTAKYVHIVRDGRDVAISLREAPFGPKTIFTAALRWRKLVELSLDIGNKVPDDHYMMLRFEDLLDDPESELKRVCHFLGEPYHEAMLRFSENTTPYPTDSINNVNLQKDLMPANKNKWRTKLPKAEVELIEAVIAPTLDKFDYRVTTNLREISGLELAYRKYLEPLPAKSIAMLRNKQGHEKALAKLKLIMKGYWSRLTHSHN